MEVGASIMTNFVADEDEDTVLKTYSGIDAGNFYFDIRRTGSIRLAKKLIMKAKIFVAIDQTVTMESQGTKTDG